MTRSIYHNFVEDQMKHDLVADHGQDCGRETNTSHTLGWELKVCSLEVVVRIPSPRGRPIALQLHRYGNGSRVHGQHYIALRRLPLGIGLGCGDGRHLGLGFHLEAPRTGRLIPLLLLRRPLRPRCRRGLPVRPLLRARAWRRSRVGIDGNKRSRLIRWHFRTGFTCRF